MRSVENIQQITKSMEMVAAARLQKALVKAENSHHYLLAMRAMLSRLIPAVKGNTHPLIAEGRAGPISAVVASADRGLCGAYNSNLFSALDRFLKETDFVELVIFGRKGVDYYNKRQWPIVKTIFDWGGKISAYAIKAFTEELIKGYISGKYGKVRLVYAQYQGIFSRTVINKQLLPIEAPEKSQGVERDYVLEPTPEELLAEFLPRYCIAEIQSMLNQAYASELAARVCAMRAAAKNADTMIGDLTLLSNKVRQAGITNEMLEIAIGAEAMK